MTQVDSQHDGRRRELRAFLFVTVVLAPLVAVGLVAAYGFAVWLWQILNGPPGY